MFDEHFWVAVAFFALLGLLFRPVGRSLGKALDGRSAKIAKELEDATKLREQAQAMLTLYQNKYQEISRESDQIMETARADAKAMQKQAQEELKQAVAVRIRMAEEKIAQEEKKAVSQLQQQVVELAVQATKRIILEQMHKEADDALIRLAVDNVGRIVH